MIEILYKIKKTVPVIFQELEKTRLLHNCYYCYCCCSLLMTLLSQLLSYLATWLRDQWDLFPGSLPSHLLETLLNNCPIALMHHPFLSLYWIIPIRTNHALQSPIISPSNPYPFQFSTNLSTPLNRKLLKRFTQTYWLHFFPLYFLFHLLQPGFVFSASGTPRSRRFSPTFSVLFSLLCWIHLFSQPPNAAMS